MLRLRPTCARTGIVAVAEVNGDTDFWLHWWHLTRRAAMGVVARGACALTSRSELEEDGSLAAPAWLDRSSLLDAISSAIGRILVHNRVELLIACVTRFFA